MQEYFVSISINIPNDIADLDLKNIIEAERIRGRELQNKGAIQRIWRIPGTRGNIGIWVAEDSTVLHEILESLPFFKFMTIEVTPLATHPLESDQIR
jgi:muconolactone D-isomerase